MKMPRMGRFIPRSEEITDTFGGYNDTENHLRNEFSAMKNISHRDFPSITSRKGRVLVKTLANPGGFLEFGGALYTVEGTEFKKDNTVKGSVTQSKKTLLEFNKNILIFPDMKYYDTESGTFGDFKSGNPDVKTAAIHNNRVFGVNGSNVYATKQGDFKGWNIFNQLLTDAWATDVAGAIVFNTIGTYQNHVVMQSPEKMFELYGYNAQNFQLQETVKIGANCTAYAELDSVLYFANPHGIYAYTGGVPKKISLPIGMEFKRAEIGSNYRYLYASVFDGISNHLFVYDSETKLIAREDNLNVIQFGTIGGHFHALCADGKLYKLEGGDEVVEWELETTPFVDDPFSKSGIRGVEVFADMKAGSEISLFVKTDAYNEQHIGSVSADMNRILSFPIIMTEDIYKIRLKGRGEVKIRAIKRIAIKGGKI